MSVNICLALGFLLHEFIKTFLEIRESFNTQRLSAGFFDTIFVGPAGALLTFSHVREVIMSEQEIEFARDQIKELVELGYPEKIAAIIMKKAGPTDCVKAAEYAERILEKNSRDLAICLLRGATEGTPPFGIERVVGVLRYLRSEVPSFRNAGAMFDFLKGALVAVTHEKHLTKEELHTLFVGKIETNIFPVFSDIIHCSWDEYGEPPLSDFYIAITRGDGEAAWSCALDIVEKSRLGEKRGLVADQGGKMIQFATHDSIKVQFRSYERTPGSSIGASVKVIFPHSHYEDLIKKVLGNICFVMERPDLMVSMDGGEETRAEDAIINHMRPMNREMLLVEKLGLETAVDNFIWDTVEKRSSRTNEENFIGFREDCGNKEPHVPHKVERAQKYPGSDHNVFKFCLGREGTISHHNEELIIRVLKSREADRERRIYDQAHVDWYIVKTH
jgi:hypothetical protein